MELTIEAAWLVGPSVHGPEPEHDHGGEHGHHDDDPARYLDPGYVPSM